MKRRGWFIAILVLVVVAVVLTIVFVNLFKPKNTKDLAKNVNQVVTTGYLSQDSDEYQTIDTYLQSIYTKFTTASEQAEVKNYQDSYKAFSVAGEFLNRQMVFSKYTNTYKNNKKSIEKSFSAAQSAANSMKNYIDENKAVVGGSDFWEVNTWANCKDYMKKLFSNTSTAINKLMTVYTDCVESKIMNNDLTTLIFDTTEKLSSEVETKLTEDLSCGQNLLNFVNAYLTKDTESVILQFVYNETAQANVKVIMQQETGWESLYNSFLSGKIA